MLLGGIFTFIFSNCVAFYSKVGRASISSAGTLPTSYWSWPLLSGAWEKPEPNLNFSLAGVRGRSKRYIWYSIEIGLCINSRAMAKCGPKLRPNNQMVPVFYSDRSLPPFHYKRLKLNFRFLFYLERVCFIKLDRFEFVASWARTKDYWRGNKGGM